MILDHGYVKTIEVMGSDLSVVNAARASFDKQVVVLSYKDEKLIEYLVKNYHDSPLRHAVMTLEIYAPILVKNQWIKHTVASTHLDEQYGWNEVSRRYVSDDIELYHPVWRGAPENLKQGSVDHVSLEAQTWADHKLEEFYEQSILLYTTALDYGIAPEQARVFLPGYALYVRWRWTASLQALLNFISLRLGEGAQSEIVQYAQVVADEVYKHFPVTTDAWMKYRVT